MFKNITKFSLFLVLLFSIKAAELSAQDYYVYVAAESEDEISVVKFDGKIATVEKRIPVGVLPYENEGPHGMTISPDGKHWYLSMAHGKPYGTVYKYETGTDKLVGKVVLGMFPASMEISKASGFLYVVNFNLHGKMEPSSISVVDTESMSELERITTGIMPHGSRISPDGLFHYSVGMMDGNLYEINALDLEVSRKLMLGKPEMDHAAMGHDMGGMKMMKDTKNKSNSDSGKKMKMMKKSSDSGNKMMKMKKVNTMMSMDMPMPTHKPTWVYPHPTKKVVYVANNGAAEIVEVDIKDWKIIRRFKTAPGPYNLEVSRDGKILVVSYKTDGSTGIWDLEKGIELAKITNSRKVTHGVTISPDNKYAFISVEGKGGQPGSVDVIDIKNKKLVAVAEVGKQAGGISFWKIVK